MNNYLVNVKRIQNIFDPFNSEGGLSFNKDRITQLLDKSDIFPENDQDLERQLAYVVANYERNPVHICLNKPLNIENIAAIFPQGILELAAAIYLEENTIIATIEGHYQVVKTLLSVDLNIPDDILIEDKERFEKIEWDLKEHILLTNWADKEFVLDKLNHIFNTSITTKNRKDINYIIKMTDASLWDDADFVSSIINIESTKINPNITMIDFIEEENKPLLCLPHFYEASKNNPRVFISLWHSIYKKILPTENFSESLYNHYVMQQQKYNSFNYYPSFQEQQNLIPVLDNIRSQLAFNENTVKEILQDMKSPQEFYALLPSHIKLSPAILRVVSSKNINEEILNAITPQYSNDMDWVKMFIETCCHLDKINIRNLGSDPNSEYEKLCSKIYEPWMNDKEKILTLLDKIDANNDYFYGFYGVLPKHLQLDSEVYSKFYSQNKHVFVKFPLSVQLQFVEDYVNHFPLDTMIKLPDISDSLISHIQDKNVLLKIIEKGQYKWLFYLDFPYKNDIDLMLAIPGKIDCDFVTTDTVEAIEANKNNIIALLPKMQDLYSYLSPKNRQDCYIASRALQNNQAVDSIVYNRKGFCLLAMEIFPGTANNVPKPYWQDKSFILELLDRIDQERIDKSVMDFLPKEVIKIFTAYEIESNYAKFIDNYLLEKSLQKLLPNKEATVKKKKI